MKRIVLLVIALLVAYLPVRVSWKKNKLHNQGLQNLLKKTEILTSYRNAVLTNRFQQPCSTSLSMGFFSNNDNFKEDLSSIITDIELSATINEQVESLFQICSAPKLSSSSLTQWEKLLENINRYISKITSTRPLYDLYRFTLKKSLGLTLDAFTIATFESISHAILDKLMIIKPYEPMNDDEDESDVINDLTEIHLNIVEELQTITAHRRDSDICYIYLSLIYSVYAYYNRAIGLSDYSMQSTYTDQRIQNYLSPINARLQRRFRDTYSASEVEGKLKKLSAQFFEKLLQRLDLTLPTQHQHSSRLTGLHDPNTFLRLLTRSDDLGSFSSKSSGEQRKDDPMTFFESLVSASAFMSDSATRTNTPSTSSSGVFGSWEVASHVLRVVRLSSLALEQLQSSVEFRLLSALRSHLSARLDALLPQLSSCFGQKRPALTSALNYHLPSPAEQALCAQALDLGGEATAAVLSVWHLRHNILGMSIRRLEQQYDMVFSADDVDRLLDGGARDFFDSPLANDSDAAGDEEGESLESYSSNAGIMQRGSVSRASRQRTAVSIDPEETARRKTTTLVKDYLMPLTDVRSSRVLLTALPRYLKQQYVPAIHHTAQKYLDTDSNTARHPHYDRIVATAILAQCMRSTVGPEFGSIILNILNPDTYSNDNTNYNTNSNDMNIDINDDSNVGAFKKRLLGSQRLSPSQMVPRDKIYRNILSTTILNFLISPATITLSKGQELDIYDAFNQQVVALAALEEIFATREPMTDTLAAYKEAMTSMLLTIINQAPTTTTPISTDSKEKEDTEKHSQLVQELQLRLAFLEDVLFLGLNIDVDYSLTRNKMLNNPVKEFYKYTKLEVFTDIVDVILQKISSDSSNSGSSSAVRLITDKYKLLATILEIPLPVAEQYIFPKIIKMFDDQVMEMVLNAEIFTTLQTMQATTSSVPSSESNDGYTALVRDMGELLIGQITTAGDQLLKINRQQSLERATDLYFSLIINTVNSILTEFTSTNNNNNNNKPISFTSNINLLNPSSQSNDAMEFVDFLLKKLFLMMEHPMMQYISQYERDCMTSTLNKFNINNNNSSGSDNNSNNVRSMIFALITKLMNSEQVLVFLRLIEQRKNVLQQTIINTNNNMNNNFNNGWQQNNGEQQQPQQQQQQMMMMSISSQVFQQLTNQQANDLLQFLSALQSHLLQQYATGALKRR